MSDLTVNLLGFPAVNKDLTVELRDPVSNTVVKQVKPFLDGTVRVPRIAAGAYEMTVKHPNLEIPVLRRPIRVLPAGDTKVTVLIDPTQFRNTPIEDIPEANLTPVRQILESVAETVLPLTQKQPGEAIKAEDWNTMASSIRDLASAVIELTRLVTPMGHDHPEFIRKFDEVTGNFETLLNTLTAAMAELQRQIQSLRFRRQVEDVLVEAGESPATPRGKELLALLEDLEKNVTETPQVFGRKARNVGVLLGTKLEALIDEKQDRPDFVESEKVKNLSQTVDLLKSQRSNSYSAELEQHRKADRVLGAGGLNAALKR